MASVLPVRYVVLKNVVATFYFKDAIGKAISRMQRKKPHALVMPLQNASETCVQQQHGQSDALGWICFLFNLRLAFSFQRNLCDNILTDLTANAKLRSSV